MRVLHINTADRPGGAELFACNMARALRGLGHEAWLAAGEKVSDEANVFSLREAETAAERLKRSISRRLSIPRGLENFDVGTTRRIAALAPAAPDILHAHNLHGARGFFDLRALPALSAERPFFLTLHDSWLLTGHCAHSFDCDRWQTGCGRCPDLAIYPAIRRDATAENWKLKREVFAGSRLNIGVPCRWMLARVEESILAAGAIETRVIPHGIDLNVFNPGEKLAARKALGISNGAPMVLILASALTDNVFKDAKSLRAALARLGNGAQIVAVGGKERREENVEGARVRIEGPVPNEQMPEYFRAADVYVHSARADTFPTVILEAQACGCPVVATAVGGIPEQIIDGQNGFLARPEELADKTRELLLSEALRQKFSAAAAEHARGSYSFDRTVRSYLAWYEEMLREPRREKPSPTRQRPALPWRIPKIESVKADEFRVTAIVSTYKSEEFIRGCLEDLIGQTIYKTGDLEILVIDSGSPENEGEIVKELQAKHPNIVYVRTEREPLYTAWNRAFGLARGKYITNANTDDRHRPDALEKMAAVLDADPNIALAFGDMLMTQQANKTWGTATDTHLYPFADYSHVAMLGEGRCGPHPMWRKALHLELGGFVEEFKVASDFEWWLRLSEKYRLHRIREPLSLYMNRADSIEHRQIQTTIDETEYVRRYYAARAGIDRSEIMMRPENSFLRFFWRMNRSIRKRVKKV